MTNSHSLAHIVSFLSEIKARGIYGTTTIIWRGADIPKIEHLETYLPGGLPKISAPVVSVAT